MRLTKISDALAIAPQLATRHFAEAAVDGFVSVINNRPEGEEADQPSSPAEKRAADAAGLGYSFIPVSLDTITEADVRAFQDVLRRAGGPVLAHCRSGLRSLTLYALGETLDGRLTADDVRAFGRRFGHELEAAERWLAQQARRRPGVKGFFEPRSSSVQYVVCDPDTARCAIVDPVLDFDEKSGATATRSADALLAYISAEGLTVEWILETHPHADHLSAARYLKGKTGAPIAIGERVVEVQRLWKAIYNWPDLPTDGSHWDRLFAEGHTFRIGSMEARVLFSPGHTLASITYLVGDAAFVHDTVFMPDGGTARADFPGGDARQLWTSIQAVLALPEETRVFTGHDYQPGGRAPRWESSVGEQRRRNVHLQGAGEADFVLLRTTRDRQLAMPRLILPALQVNIRGGALPEPELNGRRYLKIPLDALPGAVW